MRCNILIWCFWLFSLCFVQKGVANVVLDPQTNRPISADSILNNVMTFAPFYEKLVTDYRADLYIKGTMDIKRKNFILRYVPSMFRLQKGVRQYMVETYSDLHFTAPNIYDQKVKASMGTVHNSRGVPGMLEYFNINLYSSTLLYDRLLSPLAKNGRKYYKYLIDSIMGGTDNRQYKIRFIPRSKSDQLVGGYMIVSSDVWSVREIRFSGRSELLLFSCLIKMGSVGKDDEFLPVSYNVEGQFNFLGNRINGVYVASLNYHDIVLEENQNKWKEKVRARIKGKSKYDLSDSYNLQCETTSFHTDSAYFETLRPIPLSEAERRLYKEDALRKDTIQRNIKPKSKSQVFWGQVGDVLISDYKLNLSNLGSVKCSPLINPFLLSYSGSNGLSYRQSFKYNRLFKHDRLLRVVPKLGYNFTRKEFYWSINTEFNYLPEKMGAVHIDFGNGNRIYSSDVLDDLKAIPDSVFDFNQIHLDYFYDLYFNFRHSTGQYERLEFDLQHHIPLGLMRNIYYRFGFGMFTNQKEMYFVDFNNFTRSNLPEGWNDEIGGVFQLLDRRWYNASRKYIRGHFTYEAPFLLLKHLIKYTRYVQNERLYASILSVPHLQPYVELGYGIGTHIFDFGVFVGSENWKYTEVGCKFTFELFNR